MNEKQIEAMQFNKKGRPTTLCRDEEAIVVAKIELEAASGQGKKITSMAHRVNELVEALQDNVKVTTNKSKIQRARRILKRVNEREADCEGNKKKKTKTGEIKVQALSKKRAKHSDPHFSWVMFHQIYQMFKEAKKVSEIYFDKMIKKTASCRSFGSRSWGPPASSRLMRKITTVATRQKKTRKTTLER